MIRHAVVYWLWAMALDLGQFLLEHVSMEAGSLQSKLHSCMMTRTEPRLLSPPLSGTVSSRHPEKRPAAAMHVYTLTALDKVIMGSVTDTPAPCVHSSCGPPAANRAR